MDAASQVVQIKFVDEVFRIESRSSNDSDDMNGDTPDLDGEEHSCFHTVIFPYYRGGGRDS